MRSSRLVPAFALALMFQPAASAPEPTPPPAAPPPAPVEAVRGALPPAPAPPPPRFELSAAARAFVAVEPGAIALTHVRVIDGTGAPAREDRLC